MGKYTSRSLHILRVILEQQMNLQLVSVLGVGTEVRAHVLVQSTVIRKD